MEYNKPILDTKEIIYLVQQIFGSAVNELNCVTDGQIAQTYMFSIGHRVYYISINYENMSQVINTEKYFSKYFTENKVPFRPIIDCGIFKEYYYLITEKVEGIPFHQLDLNEQLRSVDSVFDVFFNIYKVPTNQKKGYGWFNANCDGVFSSWTNHIKSLIIEDKTDFYGEWHKLFDTTILEKDVFYRYYNEIEKLINYIPNYRNLVHGGFGYGNLLIDNGKVSAVIDWQDSRYGDNIFDIAYMLFWPSKDIGDKYFEIFLDKAKNERYDLNNITERMKCYKYYIGLDAMRFFSITNNDVAYNCTKKVLDTL